MMKVSSGGLIKGLFAQSTHTEVRGQLPSAGYPLGIRKCRLQEYKALNQIPKQLTIDN
jgi:hypothetical protein